MFLPVLCALAQALSIVQGIAPPALSPPAASAPSLPVAPVPLPAAAPPAPNLNADARLSHDVTLQAKGQPLDDLLRSLQPPAVPRLRAAPQIGQRRVSVFAERVSLRLMMQALADTTEFTWRAGSETKPGADTIADAPGSLAADYTLFQSEAARKRERKQTDIAEEREKRAHDVRRDAMQGAIQDAVNARGSAKAPPDVFADMLASLTREQQQQAAELSTQPQGVIAADNNRNCFQNMVGVQSFADLPPGMQANLHKMLGVPESIGSGKNSITFSPAAKSAQDLHNSSVGFVAVEGTVTLAVVAPDGSDVWLSRDNVLPARRMAPDDTNIEGGPELAAQIAAGTLLDLSGVPDGIRAKRLHFAQELDHGSLPDLLQSLAHQTGLAIVADDFVRSRQTMYFWLLTDKPDYTLDEACGQISKAFGHRMIYKDGVLRVQTVSPGPDLRVEPPADVLARLHDMTVRHLPVTLADYEMLGRLTRAQLDTLVIARLPGITQGTLLLNAQRAYSVLRFYALLPPDLRERATRATGLPLSALNARQTEAFAALSQLGALRVVTDKARVQQAGLTVLAQEVTPRYSRGKALRWTFDVVPDRQAARIISYTLEP